MGVELGKRLAKQVRPLLDEKFTDPRDADKEQPQKSANEFDSSTLNLLNQILSE